MKIKPQLPLVVLPLTLLCLQPCSADPPPPKQSTAFDFYASAAASEKDRHKVDFANGPGRQGSGDPDDRDYTEAEKASLVKENVEALTTLRRGLTLPYQDPPPQGLMSLVRFP